MLPFTNFTIRTPPLCSLQVTALKANFKVKWKVIATKRKNGILPISPVQCVSNPTESKWHALFFFIGLNLWSSSVVYLICFCFLENGRLHEPCSGILKYLTAVSLLTFWSLDLRFFYHPTYIKWKKQPETLIYSRTVSAACITKTQQQWIMMQKLPFNSKMRGWEVTVAHTLNEGL